MHYERYDEIFALLDQKLITRRKHPDLPLYIHNYSASAQHLPISEWTPALCDCRGLILDDLGNVVARGFRKFWNLEQVLDKIPSGEGFTVWEKLDGSLGIVCEWNGHLVIATRGSFESDQAVWAKRYMGAWKPPVAGMTYLFELIFPQNRIVVDYGSEEKMTLLAVLDEHGADRDEIFNDVEWFHRAKCFDGLRNIAELEACEQDAGHAGHEGFVIRWHSGFRAKVKFAEYKRLHRLITQCSTRTIWEMLRTGADTTELLDRVPEDFKAWANEQIASLTEAHMRMDEWAVTRFDAAPKGVERKVFAEYAKKLRKRNRVLILIFHRFFHKQTFPHFLVALYHVQV